MCDTLSQPSGVDISTVGELKAFLQSKGVGILVNYGNEDSLNDNECLCSIDLKKTLELNNIKAVYKGWGWELD